MLVVTTHVALGRHYAGVKEVEDFGAVLRILRKNYKGVYFCANNEQINTLNSQYNFGLDNLSKPHEKSIILRYGTRRIVNVRCICTHPTGYLMVYGDNGRMLINPETMEVKFRTTSL